MLHVAAIWSAAVLALLSGQCWSIINFVVMGILVVALAPTIGRMDRWVRRRVGDLLETAWPIELVG